MLKQNRSPRILYLSFYFPPSRASGVYRGRATANLLAQQGWDVTVLAAPLDFLHDAIGSVDESLLETVDPRIRVERPRLSQVIWQKDIRRFSTFRRYMPRLSRRFHGLGQDWFFPERYESWARSSLLRAMRLHAKKKFDVVLATGNPYAAFAAAWMFNRLTGVPYVLDNRDAWTLDLFEEAPRYPEGHPARKWEQRVLRRASGLVLVNEALRAWHADQYPDVADRMMVVPNGWDPDLLSRLPDAELPDTGHSGPLRYGYLGTLTGSQPLEEMVDAFGQAREHSDLAGAELHLWGHMGFFAGGAEKLAGRLGLDSDLLDTTSPQGVRYRGGISKQEVGSVYQECDVLVFLAGGARYVTSGKIFEYMAAGRPIVSVHAPGIAAEDVLSGYPLWFNADSLDVNDVAQAMIAAGKAARDMSSEQHAAARQHAERYRREVALRPLLTLLEGLTRHDSGKVAQSR